MCMNLKNYDTLFEDFLTKLVLTKKQADAIEDKMEETLSLFLAEHEGDVEIYAQGSYAMGTTVRPLSKAQNPHGVAGEYDVDMVLQRSAWTSADESLKSVRSVLNDIYKDKVDGKLRETCERVFHDVDPNTEIGFHVDYVPIKLFAEGRHAAKRTPNKWFPSDTKHLAEWFNELSQNLTYLPSLILIIKRIRDTAGNSDLISSICITALVCNLYEEKQSYAEELLAILEGIVGVFDVPHQLLSIRLEPLEDDLADRIDEKQHTEILTFFKHVLDELSKAFTSGDIKTIRNILSTSFPANFENFPGELEPLRNRGWGIETNGSLKQVEISETGENGSLISRVRKKFYGAGEQLVFRANVYDKHSYGVRWQVLNEDGSPSRRGNLFSAKGPSGHEGSNSNEYVNYETESYNGEHWIKYYVYDKSTKRVVEIGEKFFVEVEK